MVPVFFFASLSLSTWRAPFKRLSVRRPATGADCWPRRRDEKEGQSSSSSLQEISAPQTTSSFSGTESSPRFRMLYTHNVLVLRGTLFSDADPRPGSRLQERATEKRKHTPAVSSFSSIYSPSTLAKLSPLPFLRLILFRSPQHDIGQQTLRAAQAGCDVTVSIQRDPWRMKKECFPYVCSPSDSSPLLSIDSLMAFGMDVSDVLVVPR